MNLKNLLFFAVIFALVALGTSCSKPSEKNIVGKWKQVSFQFRDSSDPEWREFVEPGETIIGQFKNDGTVDVFINGEFSYTTIWSYEDGVLMYDHFNYDIEKFSSKEMVWYDKEDHSSNGVESWFEERRTWEKAK